jgi:hypothetical protein
MQHYHIMNCQQNKRSRDQSSDTGAQTGAADMLIVCATSLNHTQHCICNATGGDSPVKDCGRGDSLLPGSNRREKPQIHRRFEKTGVKMPRFIADLKKQGCKCRDSSQIWKNNAANARIRCRFGKTGLQMPIGKFGCKNTNYYSPIN